MSALAGIVGKEETTCRSKTTEERANSSRCGVLMNGFPYAPKWSLRNVSATIITTFGRSMFTPLLLPLSTTFVNNNEGDSRARWTPRQEQLRRNFKELEDFL